MTPTFTTIPASQTAALAQTSTVLQFLIQNLGINSEEIGEGGSEQSPREHFPCTRYKEGGRVGAGRQAEWWEENQREKVIQCVEHHREAKMRVWEEASQSDV